MEITQSEKVSLDNIGLGAAVEKFNKGLEDVLANILDPNTDAKAKREINLKVVFAPAESRTQSAIGVFVTTKLVMPKPFVSTILLGKGMDGEVEAHELQPMQMPLFDMGGQVTATVGKVTSISKAR